MSVPPSLLDDRLLIRLLTGDLPASITSTPLCTTTGYWFRLARALASRGTTGQLSRAVERLSSPERELLLEQIERLDQRVAVADVRALVPSMARLAATHGLNLLAAEVAAAALVFTARIIVAPGDLGPRLSAAGDALGIDVSELRE